jgi:hypothetical protein
VNLKFGLDDLKERRLKIATIEDLNDPFEILGFSNRHPEMRKGWLYIKADINSRMGLLCFSKNWSNPVQWSHYADGHRGLCLGFDVPKRHLIDVTYSDKRFEPNLGMFETGGAQAQIELKRVFSTKFIHWRYENEVRSIIPLRTATKRGDLYFESFSPIMHLREVIVGHRSPVTRKQLSNVLKKRGEAVSLIKARLSFNDFRVVLQKNDDLWL